MFYQIALKVIKCLGTFVARNYYKICSNWSFMHSLLGDVSRNFLLTQYEPTYSEALEIAELGNFKYGYNNGPYTYSNFNRYC